MLELKLMTNIYFPRVLINILAIYRVAKKPGNL